MSEIGPEHPLTYRREVVERLFQLIQQRESCVVIGSSSMGKSRLIEFILRAEVQRHFWPDNALLMVNADSNRLAEKSEWGLYELLLTALIEASVERPELHALRAEFAPLHSQVVTSRNALLAQRYLELAARVLCRDHKLTVCVLLDEFDESYRQLPASVFANLRALRDANKYHWLYVLFLRDHPGRLRPADKVEGFYELLSRSVLGLGPFTNRDAEHAIRQLEVRKQRTLTAAQRRVVQWLSGGHPGMMVGLIDGLAHNRAVETDDEWLAWGSQLAAAQEECRKLWYGLAEDERLALGHIDQGLAVPDELHDLLKLKGLIVAEGDRVGLFSPIFRRYVQEAAPATTPSLLIDLTSRSVVVEGKTIRDLTALEFDFVACLHARLGHVCTRDEILACLHPDEQGGEFTNSAIDSLVKRIRRAIEPVPGQPRYLLTARGVGYRLVDRPEQPSG